MIKDVEDFHDLFTFLKTFFKDHSNSFASLLG